MFKECQNNQKSQKKKKIEILLKRLKLTKMIKKTKLVIKMANLIKMIKQDQKTEMTKNDPMIKKPQNN